MSERRPVDIKRDSGGAAEIGSDAEGAVKEMFEFDGVLLVVKEKALYEFAFADKVDPKRENPDLPHNFQRLVLNQGYSSEIVCRTFLTAKRLFQEQFISASIDSKKALQLSLEALKELIALDDEIQDYLAVEQKVTTEYEERKGQQGSYAIPSIPDVATRCKTIFQKADHVTQTLMEIITVFYPNEKLTPQSHFPKFLDVIRRKYGNEDPFTVFVSNAMYFLELIRSLRNCLDHRLADVKISDFELQVNSDILSPTIEVNYRNSELKPTSLASFLPVVTQNLTTIFETLAAYLSNKNAKADAGLPKQVLFIPEARRINKFVRYSFWSPLGEGGYFYQ